MPNYCVNTGGDHEVHNTDTSANCGHLPNITNRKTLGWHANDDSAMKSARAIYTNADGCFYCIDKKYNKK
ncbi:MAG TPA: hypothetical protein PK031_02780 [Pseudomonadales bacterium]|nr:hypothetical protein [Pseudomonadales bacterium]